MSHNWENPPPLPDRGDDDRDAVFLGVGKIMSAWETIEFELSRLYSVFAGDPDGAAMRDYGKPTIARLRLDGLSEMADKFFIKRPSQDDEGEFLSILTSLRHFATRRNEVAHGIVFDTQPITVFSQNFAPEVRGKPQYALIAPYYQIKQHDDEGMPAYAYTSRTLGELIPAMAQPFLRLERFRRYLLGEKSSTAPSKPSDQQEKARRRNALQRRARRRQRQAR